MIFGDRTENGVRTLSIEFEKEDTPDAVSLAEKGFEFLKALTQSTHVRVRLCHSPVKTKGEKDVRP